MNQTTNTPELTADDRALYETFEKARAGSTRPVGTLRGIRAALDKLRQGCEPVASAPVAAPSDETLRLAGVIADKIEDGTLFQAGLFSRRELADKVRAVVRFVSAASAPVAGEAKLPWHLPVQHWTDEEKAKLPATPQASASVRIGRAATKSGRVQSFAFEQTDLPDGEHALTVSTPQASAPVAGEAHRPHLNVVLDHAADRLADAGMREDASIVRGMKVPNDGSKTEPFNAAPQASADGREVAGWRTNHGGVRFTHIAELADVWRRLGWGVQALVVDPGEDARNEAFPAPQPADGGGGAASKSAKTRASVGSDRGAAEGDVVLPSLPPPFSVWHEDDDDAGAWGRPSCNVHTAAQMQEYARAAVLADRQQRGEEIASLREMLEEARGDMSMVRMALGVNYEPHQSLFERTMEACEKLGRPPLSHALTFLHAIHNCADTLQKARDLAATGIEAIGALASKEKNDE